MDIILLNNIAKSLDRITAIEHLKEMREIMKTKYVLGSITKEDYKDFIEEEIRTIQKLLEEVS